MRSALPSSLPVALVVLAACRTAPPPAAPLAVPPGLEFTLELERGSVLAGSGARPSPPGAEAGPASAVRIQVLGLSGPLCLPSTVSRDAPESEPPPAAFEPLSAHARLVRAQGAARPLEPALQAAGGASLLRGDPAQALYLRLAAQGPSPQRVPLVDARRQLPRGSTLELTLLSPDPPPPTPRPPGGARDRGSAPTPEPRPGPHRERLALRVGHGPDGLQLALGLPTGEPPRVPELGDGAGAAAPPRWARTEWVLLEGALEPAGGALVLQLPRPFPWGDVETLAIGVWVAPAEGALDEDPGEGPGEGPSGWAELGSTLAALRATDAPRAALAHLATELGAPSLLDLALAAGAADLAQLRGRVVAALEGLEGSEAGELAWVAEREALRTLVERVEARGGEDPAARALLSARAGEAGAFPGTLADVLATRRGLAELESWLVEENRAFLLERSPAARVRAFDWLAARGLAPQGFDPLAGEAERRASLEAAALGASEGAR